MLPTKFQVNRPFGSGKEVKNKFSIWLTWRPSWISDRNDFSYFEFSSHPDALYLSFKSICLSVQETKRKKIFNGGNLGFPIRTTLAILIYNSRGCFLQSFKSFGFLVQEKKRKIDFQDGHHGGHFGFSV